MYAIRSYYDEINELILKGYTEGLDESVKALSELYSAWKSGDAEKLAEFSDSEEEGMTADEKKLYDEYNKAMLVDRNIGMVEKAEQYMNEGKNTFYVVGAMHMVGKDGIVELLKANGYTVTKK